MLKTTKLTLTILTFGFSSLAFAAATLTNLTISNSTDYDSTTIINNGPCSTILGEVGITRAHHTNVVPEKSIVNGCIANKANCRADVHMTSDCSGPIVATVYLDIKNKTGIKKIEHIKGSGYDVIKESGFSANIINEAPEPATVKTWFHKLLGL